MDVLAPPYRLDGKRLPLRHIPPPLGNSTQSVLTELLDLSDPDIAHLRTSGVI